MAIWKKGNAFIPEAALFPLNIIQLAIVNNTNPIENPIIDTVPRTLRKIVAVTKWSKLNISTQ